jgi:hypothetical protein
LNKKLVKIDKSLKKILTLKFFNQNFYIAGKNIISNIIDKNILINENYVPNNTNNISSVNLKENNNKKEKDDFDEKYNLILKNI